MKRACPPPPPGEEEDSSAKKRTRRRSSRKSCSSCTAEERARLNEQQLIDEQQQRTQLEQRLDELDKQRLPHVPVGELGHAALQLLATPDVLVDTGRLPMP